MTTLREGTELTVVMLGDSIVNDTAHSHFEHLLMRDYPTCTIQKKVSVRGSTGCWWYKEEGRAQQYVLDHDPDLVMIGGISQRNDIESIRSVIHQIREARPDTEFLLEPVRKGLRTGSGLETPPPGLSRWGEVWGEERGRHPFPQTSPHCHEPRTGSQPFLDGVLPVTGPFGNVDPRKGPPWRADIDPDSDSYDAKLMQLAEEEKCEFFHLRGAWGTYIRDSQWAMGAFKRDRVHANDRGKQILGRLLRRYFAPRTDLQR